MHENTGRSAMIMCDQNEVTDTVIDATKSAEFEATMGTLVRHREACLHEGKVFGDEFDLAQRYITARGEHTQETEVTRSAATDVLGLSPVAAQINRPLRAVESASALLVDAVTLRAAITWQILQLFKSAEIETIPIVTER